MPLPISCSMYMYVVHFVVASKLEGENFNGNVGLLMNACESRRG